MMTMTDDRGAAPVSTRKQFTPAELRRLRELVKCVHCGAVPEEVRDEDGQAVTRMVNDNRGVPVALPWVTTTHGVGCPEGPEPPPVPAGEADEFCPICCAPIRQSPLGRARVYCSPQCRQKAAKTRKAQVPS